MKYSRDCILVVSQSAPNAGSRARLVLLSVIIRRVFHHLVKILREFLTRFFTHCLTHLFGPARHGFGVVDIAELAGIGEIFQRGFLGSYARDARDELAQFLAYSFVCVFRLFDDKQNRRIAKIQDLTLYAPFHSSIVYSNPPFFFSGPIVSIRASKEGNCFPSPNSD